MPAPLGRGSPGRNGIFRAKASASDEPIQPTEHFPILENGVRPWDTFVDLDRRGSPTELRAALRSACPEFGTRQAVDSGFPGAASRLSRLSLGPVARPHPSLYGPLREPAELRPGREFHAETPFRGRRKRSPAQSARLPASRNARPGPFSSARRRFSFSMDRKNGRIAGRSVLGS